MHIFEEEFDMESYVKKRLLSIKNLESRHLLSAVVEGMFMELHGELAGQYTGLEERVLGEVPMPTAGPAIITTIIDKRQYDITDDCLVPMQPEDMRPDEVNTAALLTSLNQHEPFYLYTVFLQADHRDISKFDRSERSFRGVVKTQYSEYTARFHVKRNLSYRRQIEQLYRIFRINYLPWRSLCAPYLFKLFDVYIDTIDNWDAMEDMEEAVVDFEEYAASIRYHHIPLWNLESVSVHTSVYPNPCLTRTNHEHQIFRRAFQEQARYLITNNDRNISNIRWTQNDLIITCAADEPVAWDMYQCNAAPQRSYPHRLLSNAPHDSFAGRLMGVFGQPIKTKLELSRVIEACGYDNDLHFTGVELIANFPDKETYSIDEFIQDELRTGSSSTAMRLDFQPVDYDSYLNRDIMSYIVSIVQRHFPEYECCGRLV